MNCKNSRLKEGKPWVSMDEIAITFDLEVLCWDGSAIGFSYITTCSTHPQCGPSQTNTKPTHRDFVCIGHRLRPSMRFLCINDL